MANLILASERVNKSTGAMMWHVYATINGEKAENTDGTKNEFYFYEPLKALRFAFILRKRIAGAFMPKAVYNKLMAAVKAAKPVPEAEQGESAPVPTASEITPAPAPEEPKPAKKVARKRNTKKAEKK